MNRKKLNSWEVKLYPLQIIILFGIILGSLASSYYLGFFTGQSFGYKTALDKSESSVSKLPILPALNEESFDSVASEVYAKLNEDKFTKEASAKNASDTKKSSDLPKLEPIGALEAKTDEAHSINAQDNLADTIGSKGLAAVKEQEDPVDRKEREKDSLLLSDGNLLNSQQSDSKGIKVNHEADSKKGAAKVVSAVEEVKDVSQNESKKQAAAEKEATNNQKNENTNSLIEQKDSVTNAPPKTGWYVQLAAPNKLSDAEVMIEKLKKSGFPAVVETAKVKNSFYFRVLVGPEENKQRAERLLSQVKQEKSVQGNPFVKFIKTP
jgi:cell division septation protein DedD